ncbi:MAG: hypothetical protein SGBAC_002482 [Bacillariaceae sp.]
MATSVPPNPLDDPSVKDPLECPPLKWGLIGCGRVSHDFTQALKHLPSQKVVACSARSEDSAKAFADKHSVASFYGGYDGLVKDVNVEIVYIGNVHAFRRSTVEMCLLADKHVLVEKPFACSLADGEYLMGLAKERNLFIMEGMWTRFFPAVQKARNIALGADGEDSSLGDIAKVYSDFNFYAPDHEEYPTSFVYNRKLGGGAGLLVAPYPLAAATMFFKSEPDSAKVVGQVDEETGVDLQGAMVLNFPPTDGEKPANAPKLPGAGVALLSWGMACESAESTTIVGASGRMTIESPGHCPTKLTVNLKAHGRGEVGKTLEYEYTMPKDTEEITKAGGFNYPNSEGFCYEAAAVARCIGAGKKEAPQYTHAETLVNLKLIEEIQQQLGVKPVGSD